MSSVDFFGKCDAVFVIYYCLFLFRLSQNVTMYIFAKEKW